MTTETPRPYGVRNPGAPAELAQFDFLIGRWRGEGLYRNEDATRSPYRVDWSGRYILDGHAIADDARVLDEEGGLQALFVTYRFYDRDGRRWIIEVFDALQSKLVSQAPEDLSGVQIEDEALTLMTRAPGVLGRESFFNRTGDHFSYRLDVSPDEGRSWIEAVDCVEATRCAD